MPLNASISEARDEAQPERSSEGFALHPAPTLSSGKNINDDTDQVDTDQVPPECIDQ